MHYHGFHGAWYHSAHSTFPSVGQIAKALKHVLGRLRLNRVREIPCCDQSAKSCSAKKTVCDCESPLAVRTGLEGYGNIGHSTFLRVGSDRKASKTRFRPFAIEGQEGIAMGRKEPMR